MDKEAKIIEILKDQVKPALGCTEPGAVALAAARAKEILNEPVSHLIVSVDKNVLKNGARVNIPGTGECGNQFAAALSLVCGRSEYGLLVLKDVDAGAIQKAGELIREGVVEMRFDAGAPCLSITAEAFGGDGHSSKVLIFRNHTNIVYEERDGEALLDKRETHAGPSGKASPEAPSLQQQIKQYTIKELIGLARDLPSEDLMFMDDGIRMNMEIARAGIDNDVGIGIGRNIMQEWGQTAAGKARAYTAAASEARMAGWPLPVMSSAGSGNHGVTAIVPIFVMGSEAGIDPDLIRRSVALSHMITIFVKSYLGALSPICGCGVAAGVGCAAGLTLLRGGTDSQIGSAIINMISGLTGMICDGAKLGCAVKLVVASGAAIDASDMALKGIDIPTDNGILSDTPDRTIINMARVSVEGMADTDRVIVDIMQGC